ncbi:hypothetical protein APR08_003625 [Nocardia amikacinitolerans]|nr:hypothetical protein [Nocardia amikacinitolerans]
MNPRGTDDPGGSGDDPNAGDDPNQAQTDDPGTDPQTTNPAGTNPAGTTDPQSTVPQSSVPTPDKPKSYLEDPLSRPDPNRPGSPGSPGFPGGPGGPGSNPGGPGKSIPGGNPGQPGAPGGTPGARAASPTAGRPGMPGMGAPGAHAAARTTRASTRFPTISCRTAPPSCSACSRGCCRRAGSSADERTEFSARAAAVRRRGDGMTEWRWQLDGLAFGIVMEEMGRDRLPYPFSFRPEFMESRRISSGFACGRRSGCRRSRPRSGAGEITVYPGIAYDARPTLDGHAFIWLDYPGRRTIPAGQSRQERLRHRAGSTRRDHAAASAADRCGEPGAHAHVVTGAHGQLPGARVLMASREM